MSISRLGSYLFWLIFIGILICIPLAAIFGNHGTFKGPRCYIQHFYVPALDLSENPITNINYNNNNTVINPCLFFDLAFHNILDGDLVYGRGNLTFSYGQNPVGNYVIPSFYQGEGQTSHEREVVVSDGVPWENVLKAVSNGSTVVFRVDLVTWARYRDNEGFGYSKRKDVRIGADMEVDGSGMKVNKEDIRLDSGVSKRGVGIFVLFLSLLILMRCLF